MTPVLVTRPLAERDIDRSAEVLGLAFADYPWTRWVVDHRDHVARITELQRLGLLHFGLPFADVWVTTVDGTVESVAYWVDTGRSAPAEERAALGARFATHFAELEGDRSDASAAAEAEVHGWQPNERHLYLATTGTTPALQRRGLGRRTLEPGLAVADREGLAACLETSSTANVRFYEHLGFEIVRHWRIADGAGPDLWTMQREPLTHRP
jgi:GNAT superfamily N-acetyltransferase